MNPKPEPAEATGWLRRQAAKVHEQDTLAVSEETASAVGVEAWLQRRGIKYAPATGIPMDMIDEKRSRLNQARRDPLVQESVDRFATALRAGRPFPPIVCYPLGSKLVIIDGNNRHEAAKKARLTYIHGIVISPMTDGDMIQLLTVEANASHGVTPPLEWRIRQAFHLGSIGHSDEVCAEAAGVTVAQLKNARSAKQADDRAKMLRIHGFSDLPMTSKQYLNAIKLEPVFFVLGTLVADKRMSILQVQDLVRKVKTGKSEAEQLAIVAEQQELFLVENAAKKALSARLSSPKMALASGIGLIIKCDPKQLVSQIRTVNDRDIVNQRLQQAVDQILAIQVEMEQLKDMEE